MGRSNQVDQDAVSAFRFAEMEIALRRLKRTLAMVETLVAALIVFAVALTLIGGLSLKANAIDAEKIAISSGDPRLDKLGGTALLQRKELILASPEASLTLSGSKSFLKLDLQDGSSVGLSVEGSEPFITRTDKAGNVTKLRLTRDFGRQ